MKKLLMGLMVLVFTAIHGLSAYALMEDVCKDVSKGMPSVVPASGPNGLDCPPDCRMSGGPLGGSKIHYSPVPDPKNPGFDKCIPHIK